MAIRVKLPNGQIGEFPDDMPHNQIENVLKKQFQSGNEEEIPYQSPPERTGLSGISEDISNIPGKVADYAMDIPEEAGDSWAQIFSNPKRALKNVAAGAGELGIGAVNAPYSLAQYLKSKNVPWFKQTADYVPHIPDLGIEKAMGLDKKESGDKLLRDAFLLSPLSKAKVPERVTDITKFKELNKKLSSIEEKQKEAVAGEEKNIASENEAQSELESIKDIGQKDVGKYLNYGAEHAARGASALTHRLGQVESYWKNAYKDLKGNLTKSNFQMEKLPDFEQDMNHVLANIKDLKVVNGKFVISKQPEVSQELQSIINKAPTPKDTSAESFLSKYQDFRDARYDLLQRAKDPKATSMERKALFKAYEESKPIEESVKKALNEGLGEHRSEFDRINKGYSEQIYPLRSNAVAKKALKGKLGPNTMSDLAGHGEGQELMREMVKQDPELLRNIVGQRYASKPEGLKDINETTAEYLSEMPELKGIMADQEKMVSEKLADIAKKKEARNISLQRKIELEKEHKELKEKISRIQRDRSKIWKIAKVAAKTGVAVGIGAPYIDKLLSKYTGL